MLTAAAIFYLFGVRELPTYMQRTVTLLFTAQLAMIVLLFMIVRALVRRSLCLPRGVCLIGFATALMRV